MDPQILLTFHELRPEVFEAWSIRAMEAFTRALPDVGVSHWFDSNFKLNMKTKPKEVCAAISLLLELTPREVQDPLVRDLGRSILATLVLDPEKYPALLAVQAHLNGAEA